MVRFILWVGCRQIVQPSNIAERYDPVNDTWETLASNVLPASSCLLF